MDSCLRESTYEPTAAADLVKPPCTAFSSPLAGRWRLDGSVQARVDFTECPLISSAYACRYLGTPQSEAAARMRFSPDGCRLEPFCGASFVHWLAGRKLVLTGDSHGRQALAALACKLYKAGWVESIRGPCEADGARGIGCAPAAQYVQNRKLCGSARCTFDPDGPAALVQAGVSSGTDVVLRGGGSLHMREVSRGYQDASAAQMRDFYTSQLPAFAATMRMSANDTLVVSDMAAHRTDDADGLLAAAASLVAYHRSAGAPRVIWPVPAIERGTIASLLTCSVQSAVAAGSTTRRHTLRTRAASSPASTRAWHDRRPSPPW